MKAKHNPQNQEDKRIPAKEASRGKIKEISTNNDNTDQLNEREYIADIFNIRPLIEGD